MWINTWSGESTDQSDLLVKLSLLRADHGARELQRSFVTLSLVRGRGWTVEAGVMGTSVCCDVAGFCNPCLALSSALPSDHVHPQNAALIHGLQDSLRMRVPQKISQKHCWALQNHKIMRVGRGLWRLSSSSTSHSSMASWSRLARTGSSSV